ncbi:MAG: alpha/beta fold hydrolase [Blastocatellia bacterium]|nr:alpha/beta fold hydrolase [Blastocatellia bacterium]
MKRQSVRDLCVVGVICLAVMFLARGAMRGAEPKSTPAPARFEFLNRQGAEAAAITDGDEVKLKVAIDHEAEMATAVAFTIGEESRQVGACIIPMGKQECEISLPALGWYWSKGPRPKSPAEWYFAGSGRAEIERELKAAPNDPGLPPTLKFSEVKKIRIAPRPVVLVHGFTSNSATWKSYTSQEGWLAALGLRGYAVGDKQFPGEMLTGDLRQPLTPTNTIARNAEILAQYITAVKQASGAQMVDVVAHSMGGLITRYYLDRLMITRDVAQLVMLGTPNGGSDCASLPASLGFYAPAAYELRPGYVSQVFNRQITRRRGVPFFSLVGTPITEAFKSPCTDTPSDLVVGRASATELASTVVEMPHLHTDMTGSDQIFKSFVQGQLQKHAGEWAPSATEPPPPTVTASPAQFTRVFTGRVNSAGSAEVVVNLDEVTVAGFALYDPTRSLKVTVQGANGVVIPLDARTHGLIQIDNPESMVTLGYGFQNPRPGPWKITLEATDKTPRTGAEYALSAKVVGGAVLKAQADKLSPKTDEPVVLTAALELASQAAADATIKAILHRPNGKTEELSLAPNGNQKQAAFTPTEEGLHAIDVVAQVASGGFQIERTSHLAVDVQPDPNRGLLRLALLAIAGISVLTFIAFWIKRRREDRAR